jgi:CRISPR-associated endoribonuclease Cas6
MRFKITFHLVDREEKGYILPMNYQRAISAWVVNQLFEHKDIPGWLSDNGFPSTQESFNMFNFSSVIIPKYNHFEDQLEILSNDVFIHFSFFPMNMPEKMIFQAFLNKILVITDAKNTISLKSVFIEKNISPVFSDEMSFRLLSPIVQTYKDHPAIESVEYMYPKGEKYVQLLKADLLAKYNRFYVGVHNRLHTDDVPFQFEAISKIKSRWVTFDLGNVDESKVKGFIFDFKVKCPAELAKIGFYAGFGEMNSLGFGCVKIL